MAVLSGFPQSVTYQSVTVAQGGGSENLLINPRGKINQANESAGVLAAGQYFCDGWKAGAAGAEVYIDSDGFRLVSGSILQLVPNNLESGRSIRGNMDVLMGSPVISINGDSDNELSDNAEYIQFEISGNNSKFTRIVLAESVGIPIYQQKTNELADCLRFLFVRSGRLYRYVSINDYCDHHELICNFHKVPSVSFTFLSGALYLNADLSGFQWGSPSDGRMYVDNLKLDARP